MVGVDGIVARLMQNRRIRRMGTNRQGYVQVQYDGKLQFLHRLVMSRFLGRSLTKEETVHHRNGRRWDNRLNNLRVYRIHPAGISENEMVDFLRNLGYHVEVREGL